MIAAIGLASMVVSTYALTALMVWGDLRTSTRVACAGLIGTVCLVLVVG